MEDIKQHYDEIINASNQDLVQENANTDGKSPMGIVSLFASVGSKAYTVDNLLSEDVKQAYEGGYIHIHDLDFYATGTTTCCQIPLGKVLKGGFNTGHGHMREPNNIMSAMALTSIILQANQNMQHGGQAIHALDYDLAPYVRKTYENNLRMLEGLNYGGNSEEKAWELTERETYQACEAFIHNSNSMHSRGGSQVPFISVNYGTDTSKEGRIIIKQLLLATQAGLGGGETPVFPIQVMKMKDGVNLVKGDPNYDLFRLALETTAKRLFPNYVFIDAPQNIQYYDGTPESEISSMGCVDGDEIITYRRDGWLYVEPFEKAYKQLARSFGETTEGSTKFVALSGVEIYDTRSGGFVECRIILKNPDKGDWKLIKFSNGRTLLATEDHPLPTDRGRLFVSDMVVGEKVPITFNQYAEDYYDYGLDKAWLDGLLICDSSYSSGNIRISLGLDEKDVVDNAVQGLKEVYGINSETIKQVRGDKGVYYDVVSKGSCISVRDYLEQIFEGVRKKDRSIPHELFNSKREGRLAFLAGMIDADGHVKDVKKSPRVELGSTNKKLALQQMALIQSLGIAAKTYLNKYSSEHGRYRYKVEFYMTEELNGFVRSKKKSSVFQSKTTSVKTPDKAEVVEIIDVGYRGKPSYDVTTSSDTFDVSGIVSHNCRTRTISNVNGKETPLGRGNLSFTTINLPLLAVESKGVPDFFDKLDHYIDTASKQLYERFLFQSKKTAANFKFLYGQGLWEGGEYLEANDELGEILRQGTLSVGYVGLAETLTALTGKHHGESEESQELGLSIIEHMRNKMDEETERTGLNYTLLASPAESYAGKALKFVRKKHGVIPGVTDKEWFTNSNHVPVEYEIAAHKKIAIEAPYHNLTNAGHITYVELREDASKNINALETLVHAMKDNGIGYGSFNVPVDRCVKCRYNGVIYNECPKCGNEDETKIERIRRITGYLVGSLSQWNTAKQAEETNRVKHGGTSCE